MGQPGLAGSQFPGEDAVMRRIKDLERTVQQLAAANQLATAGIKAVENGIIVEGSETVNGPMEVNGNSVFNGSMSIAGALNLPAGIIGNDALANPIEAMAFHADAQSFTLNTGPNVAVVTQVVTVPAGFTQAVVNATASISAANSTGGTDTIYCGLKINGTSQGYSGRVGVPPGVAANPSRAGGVILTSLGASFTISCTGSTYAATWPSDPNNNANLDGSVIFLR